jgi:hypothetical protein
MYQAKMILDGDIDRKDKYTFCYVCVILWPFSNSEIDTRIQNRAET